MKTRLPRFRPGALGLWLSAAGLLACTSPGENSPALDGVLAAAQGGGGGLSVNAADPAFGHQGDVNKIVTIAGSGFAPGAQAVWQRNGAPDPKVAVLSTQYVSSTQLTSTINIASDASLDFYDIAVTQTSRKGGIGTESAVGGGLFEVTQATEVNGTSLIRAVNESGEMTGQGPTFWSPSGGLEIIGSSGSGWDISEDGLTIVGGNSGSGSTNNAMTWTRSGGGWIGTPLPRDPAAAAGNAVAVASDPVTRAATAIGGVDTYAPKRGNTIRREPRIWLRSGATWQRVVLPGAPGTSDGFVNDLSVNLVAVGYVRTGAAVWEPDGSGNWSVTVIGPSASAGLGATEAVGINRDGTLIVGSLNAVAVFWQRSGTGWSGPTALPGGCPYAKGVDDLGRIIVTRCPLANSPWVYNAAVIAPPYGPSNITYLGGFGDREDGPQVEAMSHQGSWIVGRAKLKNTTIGAYWRVF